MNYHYVDEGEGDPIVCVHGNPTWSFYYRNLVLALKDRHRMIAVDHIGCGMSDKPNESSFDYRLTSHIDNLRDLIRELDLNRATLVAHDWGGPIGIGAVLHLLHRFRRIVLLNTGTYPPEKIPFILRVARSPIIGQLLVQGKNQFLKSSFKSATSKPEIWDDNLKAGYLAPYSNWSNRRGIYGFVRDIPPTKKHPTWNVLQYVADGFQKLQEMPIQMIWGMQDWCFSPEVLTRMRKLAPHAEVHELRDAGHYVMEDACEQVIDLIKEFLQRNPIQDD